MGRPLVGNPLIFEGLMLPTWEKLGARNIDEPRNPWMAKPVDTSRGSLCTEVLLANSAPRRSEGCDDPHGWDRVPHSCNFRVASLS